MIYPNPSSGLINIRIDSGAEFLLFDQTGRLLKDEILDQNASIFIDDLTAGTYFYQLRTANSIESGKIVLSK